MLQFQYKFILALSNELQSSIWKQVVLCADLGRFLSTSLDEISIDLRNDVVGFVSADQKWCWSTAGSNFLGEAGQKIQGGSSGGQKILGEVG